MEKKMSDITFKMMSNIGVPIRNLFLPPVKMLAEAEIEPGYRVLDYGCGPGLFTLSIARQVGINGKAYALDIHPLAIKSVANKARRANLTNIETILSSCSTALDDESLDCVVFFDVFHTLDNGESVIQEIFRVLKPAGTMCFSDHHMKETEILKSIEPGGFKLISKGKWTFTFEKTQ